MINVLSKVVLLNVNSTCPPPCLILYQHYVHNISTLPNTLPQYPASRGAPQYPASRGAPQYPASRGAPQYPASRGARTTNLSPCPFPCQHCRLEQT